MTRRLLPVVLALAVLMSFDTGLGAAQSGDDEVKALRQQIETLQKELQTLKNRLKPEVSGARAPAPLPATDVAIKVDGAPFKGDPSAKVTVVEFSDYQCPFCARHFRETLPQLYKDYIETGKVKYVFRDLPIESIHPQALKAAEAARCAGEQGQYWEMHRLLFANPRALQPKDLTQNAQALGLDVESWEKCFASGKHAATIREEVADGMKVGARGTPTFFLGVTDPNNGALKPSRVIRGAQPYPAFKEAIESLLSSKD